MPTTCHSSWRRVFCRTRRLKSFLPLRARQIRKRLRRTGGAV